MLYAILAIALLAVVLGAIAARRVPLRPNMTYATLQRSVSETIESGRGVHVSLGGSTIGDEKTLTALAAAEVAFTAVSRAAPGDLPALITTADPIVLGVAQDRLRRAYTLRDKPFTYRSTLAQYYPGGALSMAMAAGVGAALVDEDMLTNILVGTFGAEMSLIAEAAARYDRTLFAQSARLEGQAVAYAATAAPLIGEELYAAPAYLEPTQINVGSALAQDALRYLVVGAIVALAVLSLLGVVQL